MTDERLAQIRARAATKDPDAWPDDVSLFVNAGPDEGWSRYDIWHTGGPGGPWLEAGTEQAARSILHAVDELHTLRAERAELLAEVERLTAAVVGQSGQARTYEAGYAAGKAEERGLVVSFLHARTESYAQKSTAFQFSNLNHLYEIARALDLHARAIRVGQHEQETP